MDPGRIAALLTPFLESPPLDPSAAPAKPAVLTPRQLEQISIYIDLLLRWNARINLTAIRTPEEIVTRHFGESLFAASHLLPCDAGTPCGAGSLAREDLSLSTDPPHRNAPTNSPSLQTPTETTPDRHHSTDPSPQNANQTVTSPARHPMHPAGVVDLGSGAGFPGVPIKIWSPQTPVTLIESNQKKVAFLREVIRALTLTAIDVFPRRAEDYPAHSVPFLTLRAVEHFETVLPAAARLLVPGATLALLIGQSQVPQAKTLLPTFQWRAPLTIPLSNSRVLLSAARNPSEQ